MNFNVYYYRPASPQSLEERSKIVESAVSQQKQRSEQEMQETKRAQMEFAQRQRQAEDKRIERRKSGRVASYLAAEAKHATQGPAPSHVVEQRIRLCMECPGRVDVYQGVKDDGGVGFCTRCGCPASQRSKLSVKLTLAGVTCPLSKFGPVEGTGGSAATALEAAKGVVSSVVAQLRGLI